MNVSCNREWDDEQLALQGSTVLPIYIDVVACSVLFEPERRLPEAMAFGSRQEMLSAAYCYQSSILRPSYLIQCERELR
jgi:hypothetical protein